MNWLFLTEQNQLESIIQSSYNQPIVIYKHSTRCGVSTMAKNHLETHWSDELEPLKIYYLDLLAHRSVSNEIADKFKIEHQSPQLLIIRDGACVYDASHSRINVEELSGQLNLQ